MRVLFIGGTGNISAACSRLCLERGMEVFLLNQTMDRYVKAWGEACAGRRQGGGARGEHQ